MTRAQVMLTTWDAAELFAADLPKTARIACEHNLTSREFGAVIGWFFDHPQANFAELESREGRRSADRFLARQVGRPAFRRHIRAVTRWYE